MDTCTTNVDLCFAGCRFVMTLATHASERNLPMRFFTEKKKEIYYITLVLYAMGHSVALKHVASPQ